MDDDEKLKEGSSRAKASYLYLVFSILPWVTITALFFSFLVFLMRADAMARTCEVVAQLKAFFPRPDVY